ncbi:unnamed protein product [Clonostachys byssicola]|uniref:Uncharacterized protein n=1 Tax=Clonostachys byssicola TaxID=160290 RepID=A0A9N9UZS5_9HYPO|nr:unnamed protein product [Clonostachys byssicola]
MSDSKLLNDPVLELKYVDVFWEMYLPDSRNFTPEARQYSIAGWALLAQKWVHYDGALKLALGAISLNTIGQELGKGWMIHEGRKLYGAALQGMASSVKNLHRKNQNAIIMTSRILSLFEVLFGDGDLAKRYQDWSGHVSGEEAIMMLTKPENYINRDAHDLLCDGRLRSSTFARKKCFFNDRAWKTVPWWRIRKTEKDKLIDIILEVPELLETLDHTTSTYDGEQHIVNMQTLAARLLQCEEHLKNWHEQASQHLMIGEEAQDATGLAASHLMSIYWAYRVLIRGVLENYQFYQEIPASAVSLSEMRDNILRRTVRFSSAKSGWFGKQIIGFPVGVAMRFAPPAKTGEYPAICETVSARLS